MWPGWERSAKPELHISWVAFAVTFPLALKNQHHNCRNTDHCVSLGITNGSPSAPGHTEPITASSQTRFQTFIVSGRPQNEKREWLGRGGEDRLSGVFALLPKKFQTESQESSLLHLVWIGCWHQTAQEFAPHKSKHGCERERVSMNASQRTPAKANIHTRSFCRMMNEFHLQASSRGEIDISPTPPSDQITNGWMIKWAVPPGFRTTSETAATNGPSL